MSRHFESLVRRFEDESLSTPVLVCLEGDLGVGKTTFVKELFESWGYPPSKVQSPTFLKLLEHEVPGRGLCLHLDCYRIEDADEFEKLGLESYLDANLWFVEWPELFLEYLKLRPQLAQLLGFKSRIKLEFTMLENGERSIQFTQQS
jgi:tRNA threonylcarbamoyl adenosine modification protein YjeE